MFTLVQRAFLLMMLISSTALIGQTHVAEPAVNLGDTSFLDGIAGPGLMVEQIGDGAHDGKVVDAAGQSIPGAGAVNSISGLTHIAWLSHQRVLGGWYGTEIVVTAAHVNAAAPGNRVDWATSPFPR
jgi:hypothetical protein